jgi:hypothetical protein
MRIVFALMTVLKGQPVKSKVSQVNDGPLWAPGQKKGDTV